MEKIIATYSNGMEEIRIEQWGNGKYYNLYCAENGHYTSMAGGFESFAEAEEMLFIHRPKAKRIYVSEWYKFNLAKPANLVEQIAEDNMEKISTSKMMLPKVKEYGIEKIKKILQIYRRKLILEKEAIIKILDCFEDLKNITGIIEGGKSQ